MIAFLNPIRTQVLIGCYAHLFLRITQGHNFDKVMTEKPWLNDIIRKKLMTIQDQLISKFGPSMDSSGRGHWYKVNFICNICEFLSN